MMILFILFVLIFSNTSKAIESVSIDAHSVSFTPDQHEVSFTNFKTGQKRTVSMDRPVFTALLFEEKDRKDCGCWGYVITHDKPAPSPKLFDTNSMGMSLCNERAQGRDAARELRPVTLSFYPLQLNTEDAGTDDDDESNVSTLYLSGRPFEAKISIKDSLVTHLDGIYLYIFTKKGGDYNLVNLKDLYAREVFPIKIQFNIQFDLFKFDGDRGFFVYNHPINMQSNIFEVDFYTHEKIRSLVPAPTSQLAYDVETRKAYVLTPRGVYNANGSLEVALRNPSKRIKVHGNILYLCSEEGQWTAVPLSPTRPEFPLTMEPKDDFPSLKYLLPLDCQNGRFLRVLDKDVAFYEGLVMVSTLPLEEIFDLLDDFPEHVLYTMAQIKPRMVEKMKYFTSLEWKIRRKKLLKTIMQIWAKDQPRAQKLALLYYSLQLPTEPTRQELAFWE